MSLVITPSINCPSGFLASTFAPTFRERIRGSLEVLENQHMLYYFQEQHKLRDRQMKIEQCLHKDELTFKVPLIQSSLIVTVVFVLVNVICRRKEYEFQIIKSKRHK